MRGALVAIITFLVVAAVPPAGAQSAPACDAPCATLDLPALESRLRHTPAIGFFTKLSLKQQVDDLLDHLARFHRGDNRRPLPTLRQRYDGLMGTVLGLLERRDDRLAREVAASREPLWSMLTDPRSFSKLRLQAARSDL